ncbi:MAG: hypothetical protein AMXMBFR58_34040 [Phycisphaerae bacterium]
MKSRQAVVVDLDRSRVTITLASVEAGRAVVKSCRSFVRPAEVDLFDGSAVGSWVGEKLRETGTLGAKVMLSLPRGDVVIKRLALPVSENVAQEDVVGAVRLAMSRQLSVPAEASAIDYVPLPGGDAGGDPAASQGMHVTAAALPGDRMDWCRAVARGAGIRLSRIGLRCFGAACVLAEESLRRDGGVMGVVPTGASVEFLVIESGQLMLARAVDIAWPSDDPIELEAYAERVAVEAKRTWMSHRSGGSTVESQAVIVLGAGVGAEKLAQSCSAAVERPGVTLLPSGAAAARQEPEPAASVVAASVGLLMEESTGRPGLDFIHPRRAPDRAARRRQLVLGGVFAAIVGLGTPIVFAQMELSSLDDELTQVRKVTGARQSELTSMLAEDARLRHLERWTGVKVDWVAHIGALSEQVPAPPEALVDGLNGTLSSQVDFTAKSGQYAGGVWSAAQTSSFTIVGRVKQRETAAALRGRLAAGEVYSVESPAPDTGDRFSFELFTPYEKPRKPEDPKAARQPGEKPSPGTEAAKSPAANGAGEGGR